uniref:dCMP deaminase n=1 Tax=Aegilops tauschii subsp. strangulata TaxID=200361 RepID=A0A453FL14_AEGTS
GIRQRRTPSKPPRGKGSSHGTTTSWRLRSFQPSVQRILTGRVGACLVSQEGIILGIGYNGFPRGCSDDKLPWAKKSARGDPLETKYPYVVHAEVNAILNTNHASAAGQKLYVTMFPCNECAKIIIQSGVSEVLYFVEKRIDNSDHVYVASHNLLSMAGVKVRKHQPQMAQIPINFQDPRV